VQNELEYYIKTYFGVIQSEELQKISTFFELQEIPKGTFLLKEGNICNSMSFVQSGFLRMFAQAEEKEVTQWISNKGYFATDLASFNFQNNSRWSIQAIEDTVVYTIYKENYNKIGQVVPLWHELEKLFLIKCFTMLEDRVFKHLSLKAEDRYQLFFEENPELFNQVPLQYIASMLGMSPETFSRIRKKIK
jgi:CRP-like cAMP-binding protein